ncbi:hypothetical protein NDU88_011058 [Pleurodeles waltl]|uniref:Secreted peptide n=1 Tax=Pleurodeles waltl TaxID=8319 RepID=A0AAV7S140_PLEWA|nr:hypothetical protein NDU88_011058 [Pleurodeles waltl]
MATAAGGGPTALVVFAVLAVCHERSATKIPALSLLLCLSPIAFGTTSLRNRHFFHGTETSLQLHREIRHNTPTGRDQ